ncbi:hypothetical protein, partial [Dactylosporangium salmoneum]|uniref:hypothetical protein n=1 Tax=Dactylosporangium salmoneum TaxID=53361 RepID=UPI0031E2BA6E
MVISAAADTVTCTDLTTGEPSGPALVHPGPVRAVLPAMLDSGLVVATSCADRRLSVWDVVTGRTTLTVSLPRTVSRIVS